MAIYNCLFEPKKSAIKDGAVALAISIEAPNKKVAESIVIGKLWEHFPANGDNYFKPKIWEDSEDQSRPEVGKFDEQFAQANTFDGEKWIANKPDTSVPGLPGSDEIIDLMKLPARERFATVLMFSNSPISNLGNGMFSVDNLMSETASNEGEKQEVTEQETVTDDQATQARETLNSMGYGVYATNLDETVQQEEKLSDKVKTLVQDVDQLVERIKREEQLPQASELVQSINEMQSAERDNLELWKDVFKTDERFTTAFSVNGGGTSINGTYMTMIATREFGPKGIGWGVDILEERFDNGAPITRTVKGTDGNNTWELIPDGVGGVLTEKHHVIKIRLWYIRNSVRGEEISFGCTPYIYGSKYGPICDGEATKKSLTDATKKALSALGFCADIFMGLYDNPEYRQKNKAEFALKNASENAEDAARVRQELDDKLTRVANTIASAVSENEINKVYSSIAREAEVHRKDAEAKGDTQHARYLGGRLRRLTTIKDERIAELNKAQEKAE